MDESELVRLCQKAKPRAQKALFDAYADRFFRLALRYLKIQDESEDLLMKAFVKIFTNIKAFQYRDPGSLEAWMRRIVINECLMWLRKNHNLNLVESLEVGNPSHESETVPLADGDYLYQLILELPAGYRTCFVWQESI